jgi:hypothetical protein
MIIKVRDIPSSWAIFSEVKNVQWQEDITYAKLVELIIDTTLNESENDIDIPNELEIGGIAETIWFGSEIDKGKAENKMVLVQYVQEKKLKYIVTNEDCYLLNDNGQTIERIN